MMKFTHKLRCRLFLLGFLIGFTNLHAFAAEVTNVIGKKGDPDFIFINGEITWADEKSFKDIALNTESAIVVFNSPGGLLKPALEIGKTIRIKGFATAVLDSDCASACAIAWLAGQPRMLTKKSGVGFHAAYIENERGGKMSAGVGNALVGAYLNNLGLNDLVVAYVTEASPKEIKWLSKKHADEIGLPVSILSNKNGARARANHNLAIQSKHGNKPSIKKALKFYRLSADDGFAGAQNNLGDLYETGEGVQKNDKVASYWYARAAERGEPTAYLSLSTLLSENTEDEAVLIEALKFAMLAVANLPEGYNKSQAIKTANKISLQLSPEAKAYANDLAIEWEPLYQETYLMSDSRAPKKN